LFFLPAKIETLQVFCKGNRSYFTQSILENRQNLMAIDSILVTGAASSGKSEWAENLAQNSSKAVIYIATAQDYPEDSDWQAKIEKHRQRRPKDWQNLHVPKELATSLSLARIDRCLLIDSLGTWVANWLDADEKSWEKTVNDLLEALREIQGLIIFVAEETGWGIVPAYDSGRLFRDRLGSLTRRIGGMVDRVDLVIAGRVIDLSSIGRKLV
jgi:adenosylcobinamide kinase / adenosylcobinamide-phosphate guanylyltransferase